MKKIFLFLLLILSMTALHAQENDKLSKKSDNGKASVNDSIRQRNDSLMWEKLLSGVTIKAQRQLIKTEIDRIGYDVQADEDSKTENVLEMLKKVPMVSIDAQENILVKGNSNFKIYKNGHPDPSLTKNAKEILRAMPASMVKRIEVITDPGAKEDAEGVNAILNIVMTEGSKLGGVTGSVTGSYSTLNHPNLSAFLTTQVGKAIISLDYGYGGMSKQETENHNTVERTFKDSGNTLHAESHNKNPGYVQYADVEASYEADSMNLITASFGGYFYKLDVRGNSSVLMTGSDGTPLYSYDETYWMPGYSHHSWSGQADYEHKTHRKGEKLTFSYMLALTRQHTEQQTDYLNMNNVPFDYTGNNYLTKENYTEHTIQADWTRPLWSGHKLDVGAKFIDRRNSSHNIQSFNNPPYFHSYDTQFKHTTQVSAAYLDYMFESGKWSGRAGLRYEHTYMGVHFPDGKSSDHSHHLNDWVPQASLKYQIDDTQSLKLNYTTNITRPGIEYLNPAVVTNPSSVQSGNPNLVSCHSQRLTLLYMYVGNRLTLQLAPSFNFSNKAIGIINTVENDIRHTTYANVLRLRRWQLEGYIQWKPFDTTTFVANYNLWHNKSQNPGIGLSMDGWAGFYYASISQQLPWKLRLSASSYGSVGHDPNNVYGYSRSWINYGGSLQRSFLKDDRLTIRLQATFPFQKHRHDRSVVTQGDYTGWSDETMMGRRFTLSVSFKFGKLKASVKKTDTTIENDDVVGGISKGKN